MAEEYDGGRGLPHSRKGGKEGETETQREGIRGKLDMFFKGIVPVNPATC